MKESFDGTVGTICWELLAVRNKIILLENKILLILSNLANNYRNCLISFLVDRFHRLRTHNRVVWRTFYELVQIY